MICVQLYLALFCVEKYLHPMKYDDKNVLGEYMLSLYVCNRLSDPVT